MEAGYSCCDSFKGEVPNLQVGQKMFNEIVFNHSFDNVMIRPWKYSIPCVQVSGWRKKAGKEKS